MHGSLLRHAKGRGEMRFVELTDEDVQETLLGMDVDVVDSNMIYNLLSLVYHGCDVEIVDKGEYLDNSGDGLRYFRDTTICFRCGDVGHESKSCRSDVGMVCHLCSRHGHRRQICPSRFCDRCGMFGHTGDGCRERVTQKARCSTTYSSGCLRKWRRYRVEGQTQRQEAYTVCIPEIYLMHEDEIDRICTDVESEAGRVLGKRNGKKQGRK